MNTVIFKWNPAFSSYSMLKYLIDLSNLNRQGYANCEWALVEHIEINKGDRFYWLKEGFYGQCGIVGRGIITSNPNFREDWLEHKGRKKYFFTFEPEILINPDALPILTIKELQGAIPDFEWTGSHSGLVLTAKQTETLDALWDAYVRKNSETFEKAATLDCGLQDLIYDKKFIEWCFKALSDEHIYKQIYKIAKKYADNFGEGKIKYDKVENAGAVGGYQYFIISSSQHKHHKLGLPHTIKISPKTRNIVIVSEYQEKCRAMYRCH